MNAITVAIDGPAASGKSTVGAIVAERLGYVYFDTGVMYRAVTWAALDRGIRIDDKEAVCRLAETIDICVLAPTISDGRQYTVLANGVDITWAIREPAVNRGVSPVSAYPRVRTALVAQQRRIGSAGGVVMVGRDIGTVVLPEAEVKIYLDASPEERARRRWVESGARGQQVALEDVLTDLVRRDRIDSTRDVAPLMAAPDAVSVDSTALSIDQVVALILTIVRSACGRLCAHAP